MNEELRRYDRQMAGRRQASIQGNAVITREVVPATLIPCAGDESPLHGKVKCGDCGDLVTTCSCKGDDAPIRHIPGPCDSCKRVEVQPGF